MANATICRVCLDSSIPLHNISDTPLHRLYEGLTYSPLLKGDKPYKLCHLCHAHLQTAFHFTAKAIRANQILDQLIKDGVSLSEYNYDPSTMSPADRKYFDMLQLSQTSASIITVDPAYPEYEIPVENITDDFIKTEIPFEVDVTDDFECSYNTNYKIESKSDTEDDIPLDSVKIKIEKISKGNKNFRQDEKESENKEVVTQKEEVLRKRKEKKEMLRNKKKELRRKEINLQKLKQGILKGLIPITEIAREITIPLEQQIKEFKDRAESTNYINSPFKCEICYKGFLDTKTFENHQIRHDEKSGPFSCNICQVRYRRRRELRGHVANTHQTYYECLRCTFKTRTIFQAREHEKWHLGKRYDCKLCGQQFSKVTSYLTHKRKHHGSEHICTWCGEAFISNKGLIMHRHKSHHGNEPENSSDPPSERFCKECDVQFLTKAAWQKHMLTAQVHTEAQNRSLQCQICSQTMQSQGDLSMHIRKHEKEFKTKRQKPKSSLIERSKTNYKKFACVECGKTFKTRTSMQTHTKTMHQGEKYDKYKKFICEVCGKSCPCNAALIYHKRTHTGEKPYKCETCSKAFANTSRLKIHLRTHTGEKPYDCAVCGRQFKQKAALNRHHRVHDGAKPYACPLCLARFTQSNSMKLHIRTVHGHEKQYRKSRKGPDKGGGDTNTQTTNEINK